MRRAIYLAAVLAVLLLGPLAGWWCAKGLFHSPPAVAPTVSQETTYLTEPLREDGSVDYLLALDQHCREGVTTENNASALMWTAFSPRTIPVGQQNLYFQRLGIAPLPNAGNYFTTWRDHIDRSARAGTGPMPSGDDTSQLLKMAMNRPWSAKENALVAGWLSANQQPLAIVVEASRRSRRYDPLTTQEIERFFEAPLPAIDHYRQAVQALRARAMSRAGEGRVDEACDDLLAAHRLARLVGQGPLLLDALVAFAMDAEAWEGDRALLGHVRLSSAQAVRMLHSLDRLPPLPSMAEKIDFADRIVFLGILSLLGRDGLAAMDKLGGQVGPYGVQQSAINALSKRAIDWDAAAREGNAWFDRMVAAYRLPSRAQRQEAMGQICCDLQQLDGAVQRSKSLERTILFDARQAATRRVVAILVGIQVTPLTIPRDSEDGAAMRLDLARLGFALAAYRAEHGRCPTRLADLAPKYLAKIPEDLFAAGSLQYRAQAGGCLVYSVGVNGEDDGADGKEPPEACDDLSLHLPATQ